MKKPTLWIYYFYWVFFFSNFMTNLFLKPWISLMRSQYIIYITQKFCTVWNCTVSAKHVIITHASLFLSRINQHFLNQTIQTKLVKLITFLMWLAAVSLKETIATCYHPSILLRGVIALTYWDTSIIFICILSVYQWTACTS